MRAMRVDAALFRFFTLSEPYAITPVASAAFRAPRPFFLFPSLSIEESDIFERVHLGIVE